MDLNYTPEELAFQQEVREFFDNNLPADISGKVKAKKRLTKHTHRKPNPSLLWTLGKVTPAGLGIGLPQGQVLGSPRRLRQLPQS